MTLRLLALGLLVLVGCTDRDLNQDVTKLDVGMDFPAYGGNKANNRYSPLTQINADNVKNLKVAWTYFANDDPDTSINAISRARPIQCQPIVVDGILYGTSAELNLFALDAATGDEMWKFEPHSKNLHSNRGVMYWEEDADRRIFYTAGSFLYAVNALSGEPILTFGDSGKVDLHEGVSDNMDHDVKS